MVDQYPGADEPHHRLPTDPAALGEGMVGGLTGVPDYRLNDGPLADLGPQAAGRILRGACLPPDMVVIDFVGPESRRDIAGHLGGEPEITFAASTSRTVLDQQLGRVLRTGPGETVGDFDAVVVDESHHAELPDGYTTLGELAAGLPADGVRAAIEDSPFAGSIVDGQLPAEALDPVKDYLEQQPAPPEQGEA